MEIVLISLLTLVASTIGTLFGFGTSTLMIPILLFYLPLGETLLLVGVVHFFGDIWKIILFRQGIRWGIILTFGIPGIITSFFGAKLTFAISETLLSQLMGAFLIAYIVLLLIKPRYKLAQKPVNAIAGGALSGFFAGIFGISGAIRSVFLTAFDLPKAVYLATVGAIAFVVDITRITTYLLNGTRLSLDHTVGFILFIPISFLGAWVAKRFVDKIPQRHFRPIVASFLLVVGVKLLVFPLHAVS